MIHSLDKFNFLMLKAMEGEQLRIEDGKGNSLSLTISTVIAGAAHSTDYESFSTHLTDIAPERIPQGNYTFSHPKIGKHPLFCTATSATDYEIVINRGLSAIP
ncbi:hypothetical protein L2729_16095 [Shewanella gelidimarina]|uniref:DUF6916 family protein n=1 Tax=Shewanella gelidimarina TaxID=56813 RepID=UPI00200E2D02|nr:hypothetical protein [Shewanella gelidimarina]MCL1059493.1 hypothetical protein [Shewanella gelidimarina]